MNKPSNKSAMSSDGGIPVIKHYPKRQNVTQKSKTKKAVTGSMLSGRPRHAPVAPPTAAQGDDDLMSQPVTGMNLPDVSEVKRNTPSRVVKPTTRSIF